MISFYRAYRQILFPSSCPAPEVGCGHFIYRNSELDDAWKYASAETTRETKKDPPE